MLTRDTAKLAREIEAHIGRRIANGCATPDEKALLDSIIPHIERYEVESFEAEGVRESDRSAGFDVTYAAGMAYACGYHD